MDAQDPTVVMLDQLMRVIVSEALRASVWAVVFALTWRVLRRKR